jgi:CBS domain-containing protein
MQREFETTSPSESLDAAFARLQACRCRTMPVVERGRLVGVLTAENVGEYVMIQGARG